MAWVRFSRTFNYTPSGDRRVTIQYRGGCEYPVKKECADRAVAAGAGVRIKTPPRARKAGA